APSINIMNKLGRSVLALYSYDDEAENTLIDNVIRQSIELIAQMPTIMVDAYQVKKRHFDHKSMYFHPPIAGHSFAEHILSTLRDDRQFTQEEARLLDICMILHADHGGGNNSTFTCRVLTSSGTDTYSAISGAIGSLKGPKHGGANIKVIEMLNYLKQEVQDTASEEEIKEYLVKLVKKEAGDKSGLIYGMGHAVYTISDPRAGILKDNAMKLAKEKGFEADFKILETIENLAPIVLAENKEGDKAICANVDLYSGLVYMMLGIPAELFTPLFAIARTSGWCAHRIEEMLSNKRIIRPAYKSLAQPANYIPLKER
ncbi:MAG: citrate synthase, partial [Oscillospiraceae bacterium]